LKNYRTAEQGFTNLSINVESAGYDNVCVDLSGDRKETDDEEKARLERQKKAKSVKEKRRKKKEEEERKQYERLRKKYGEDDSYVWQ